MLLQSYDSEVVLEPEQRSLGGFSLIWLEGGFNRFTALRVLLLHSYATNQLAASRRLWRFKKPELAVAVAHPVILAWHASNTASVPCPYMGSIESLRVFWGLCAVSLLDLTPASLKIWLPKKVIGLY
jgi:hypothetical protein